MLVIFITVILLFKQNGFGAFFMSVMVCGGNLLWLNITRLHVFDLFVVRCGTSKSPWRFIF